MSLISGDRRRLKADAIPSVFIFKEEVSPRPKNKYSSRDQVDKSVVENVQLEVDVPCNVDENDRASNDDDDLGIYPLTADQAVQCSLLNDDRCSIEKLAAYPKKIHFFTSFDDYEHFMCFYYCLGPAVNELNHQFSSLAPVDQLLLTLIKLRQAKEDVELSFMFDVSESTVSDIIITWINFLYFQLNELKTWPSRETVDEHMPQDFGKKFPKTRVILDATETPIQKPSHVDAQSVTWSTYKHKNTLKTMIGCTPRGVVSYVSDTYGGSASDRQIVEKSKLLKPEEEMFRKKDSVMADRGIMVQDLFAARDVFVNTPTMLKGKSQLEPEDVVKDRRVASKRIHVERVIGLGKTFKILKKELPSSKLVMGSRIVSVCFAIANFRKSIVKITA